MLKRLFWVVLFISLIFVFIFKDNIQKSKYSYLYNDLFILKNNNIATSLVKDIKNLTLASGTLMDDYQKQWLNDFVQRLEKTNNTKVLSIYYDNYNDAYLKLKNGEIKVNTNNNLDLTWNDYISAIEDKDLKEKLKNEINNLEYLDLRFINKLFYKFKTYDKENSKGILGTSTIASVSC